MGDRSVPAVELHAAMDQRDLIRSLLARGGKDKNLGLQSKDKLTLSRFDELCPDAVHSPVLGRVIFQIENPAPILHIFPVFVKGISQSFGVGRRFGGSSLLVIPIEEWQGKLPALNIFGTIKLIAIAEILFAFLEPMKEFPHDALLVESWRKAIDHDLVP
jgi:hypothetical protein